MQTNPNNPYDEVFGNLSKIVEEIVRNMPEAEHARIIGYTIVTRHASGEPGSTRRGEQRGRRPPVPGAGDRYPDLHHRRDPARGRARPYADIQTNVVRICVDDHFTTIMLDKPIDIIHSTYRVHRGVMDITFRKIPDYK